MATSSARVPAVAALSLLAAVVTPPEASAQAWVPAKGEISFSTVYQNQNVKNHLAATTPVSAGTIDTTSMVADFTFGLTDKIAIDAAIPYVMSKYEGPAPHPGTNVDDGTYRGTFSDLRFAVRYNLTRDHGVITPYVGSAMPSHDYAYYGHAAPGQRLRELQVGVFAAKLFESGIPGMFISGRYSYGFVEKVLDISHDRSSADLEVGYFFSPAFRAFAMTDGTYTHGNAIDFPQTGGMRALPLPYQPVHDQIQKVHAVHVGGGVAYSISDSMDVFASFSRLVVGRNGHALNRGITIGTSWSFARNRNTSVVTTKRSAKSPDGVTARKEGSLIRCVCQKSGL